MIYLIGSLRNPMIPSVAQTLSSALQEEVFSSWMASGPTGDDHWRDYERAMGRTLPEALQHYAAQHVFQFDKHHIERADTVVLIMPCGKSGFLELGWALGRGKRGYIVLDNPERWDVMMAFADGVVETVEELITQLTQSRSQ